MQGFSHTNTCMCAPHCSQVESVILMKLIVYFKSINTVLYNSSQKDDRIKSFIKSTLGTLSYRTLQIIALHLLCVNGH